MYKFLVIGTWNTKHEELEFLCSEIERQGHVAIRVDMSAQKGSASKHQAIREAITKAREFLAQLATEHQISGSISAGGGTNLFMAIEVMRDIPLFAPKIVMSTMVVNSVHSFRSYKDIIYVQAPCDFGVLNPISKMVLANGVKMLIAIAGSKPELDKPCIAITSIGRSGGYVGPARRFWGEQGYQPILFHAIGENTMAMAEIISSGSIVGVLDLTLKDVLDHVTGGAFGKIGRRRLMAYMSRDIPAVIAPGSVDAITVVSSDGSGIPRRFKGRHIRRLDFRWSIKATQGDVMRVARWVGSILEETKPKNCMFLIPLQGWSSISEPDTGGFYDAGAIEVFGTTIRNYLPEDRVHFVDLSINDPEFGTLASQHLLRLMNQAKS